MDSICVVGSCETTARAKTILRRVWYSLLRSLRGSNATALQSLSLSCTVAKAFLLIEWMMNLLNGAGGTLHAPLYSQCSVAWAGKCQLTARRWSLWRAILHHTYTDRKAHTPHPAEKVIQQQTFCSTVLKVQCLY